MDLHREPVVRGDDLREHRERCVGGSILPSSCAPSVRAQVGDGRAGERSVGDAVGVPAFPRFAELGAGIAALAVDPHQLVAAPHLGRELGVEHVGIECVIRHRTGYDTLPSCGIPVRPARRESFSARPLHRYRIESRRPPGQHPGGAAAPARARADRRGLVVLRVAPRRTAPTVPPISTSRRGSETELDSPAFRTLRARRRTRGRPRSQHARSWPPGRSTSICSSSTERIVRAASRPRVRTISRRLPKSRRIFRSAEPNGHVRRRERSLRFDTDRQSEAPEVRLSLNRAGVSSVRRVVHLERRRTTRACTTASSRWLPTWRRIKPACTCRALPRFSRRRRSTCWRATREPARIERLAEAIAREIVRSQRAIRADVRLRAEFGLERWTPVSGKRGEETYTLVGIAHADARRHAARRRRRGRRA